MNQRAGGLVADAYRDGMPMRVECRGGYRGEPEPSAFWLGERRVVVRAIVDRWYASSQRWVKAIGDDGDAYILRCDEPNGPWELAAFTSAQSPGTSAAREQR